MSESGFLVRFIGDGRGKVSWEQRINRPVTDAKLREAVRWKKVLASREIDVDSGDSDYGGYVTAGGRAVGRFLIVPGSEVPMRKP
jgi:hypothetical protein